MDTFIMYNLMPNYRSYDYSEKIHENRAVQLGNDPLS